jgi:receptor protein-tyrosine kinase
MSLIEQATKRLAELEKAGIRVEPTFAKAEMRPTADPLPQQAGVRVAAKPTSPLPAPSPDAASYRHIDFGRLQANGFITPNIPDSKLMHEFRIIKRPLIQNALGRTAGPVANGNLIMVTSSLPGEGKSFVSVNLAMSIAMEIDSTVLLVDADVIKPTVPKLLGLQPSKGLMDVLTQPDLSFGDVLLRTNVERLSLTLAGTPHRGASELLASDAMTRLLKEISNRYPDRIIIFDSPPLLATTESRVLASRMGQVVIVVEAERTTHGVLESALSTVESCPVVLTMLNKAQESDAGSYYGYYGYGS